MKGLEFRVQRLRENSPHLPLAHSPIRSQGPGVSSCEKQTSGSWLKTNKTAKRKDSARGITVKKERLSFLYETASMEDILNEYYLYLGSEETVSFFLPFALRAASTLLPFGVDILSLKPCLLALFLLDG